jgi:hypothetical protein
LNGNGEKVLKPTLHTLWQPRTDSGASTPEPLWYLRVHALKDSEGQGDCPSRRFVRSSFLISPFALEENRHKANDRITGI